MAQYIMSIDQGTTGTTVALMNEKGALLHKVNREFRQIFPQPGWVEHNPTDIWKSVVQCIEDCLALSRVNPKKIIAIGITNQRETSVIWDRKTHKAVYNAIVWQCRRTTEYCEQLKKKKGLESQVYRKTGLVLDPYFSATKLRWVLSNVSGVKKKAKDGRLACGTIDSYLLWKLTKGKSHQTDVSNASRTLLMDIGQGEWDQGLLKLFGIPENLLPEIVPSSGLKGVTQGVPGLPDGIPISGMAGDQQAALFGQACFKPGEAKCTFGTGSFLLMNTGAKKVISKTKLLTTVAWQLEGDKKLTYALEGGAFVCGAAVQWLRDEMKLVSSSSEVEALASQVKDTGGVEFIPALAGMGAPYWEPKARGMILGLSRGTGPAHIARATLEAMALQNVDILLAMEKDLGRKLKNLKVDGGAVANNLLMEMQSNFLGSKLYRPKVVETTVAGAAYLAGLGVGVWSGLDEIKKIWAVNKIFSPKISAAKRNQRRKDWLLAVDLVCRRARQQ